MGFTQWLTLRKRINKAGWWIPANVVGWLLMGLVNDKSTTNAFGIVPFALIPALTTGITLWLLLGLSKGGGLNEQAIVENNNTDTEDPHRNRPGLQRHAQAGFIGVPGSMIHP